MHLVGSGGTQLLQICLPTTIKGIDTDARWKGQTRDVQFAYITVTDRGNVYLTIWYLLTGWYYKLFTYCTPSHVVQAVRMATYGRPGCCYIDFPGNFVVSSVEDDDAIMLVGSTNKLEDYVLL